IDMDVERVKLVRELAGPQAHIKLDANGAWDVDTAIANLKRLEPYQPSAIETPVPTQDLDGMLRVKQNTTIPFMEHAGAPERTLAFIQRGIVACFKVCPPGFGSLRATQQVLGIIAAAGKQAYIGSDVEMGLGTLALAHFAAASPECDVTAWPCDLRGPLLLV